MTCFMCRGDMEDKLTTFMVEADGCIIIVKGVPSHVCTQCGEVSYDTNVVMRLEKIVAAMKKSSTEIVVSSYEAA